MRWLLMIALTPLNVFGTLRRSNDTVEKGAEAAATAAELPQPSLFLVLTQPLRSLDDLRSLTSKEEEVEPTRIHSEEETMQKEPDEVETNARYMRPVRRTMMAEAQRDFVNRAKRHNRGDGRRCCRCCPRPACDRYPYDSSTSIEDADEPFINRRKRQNREDDRRCCSSCCPRRASHRYPSYNDESSFESRESSRDYPQRRPYSPPRGDSRRRDDFVQQSSEFPPSPRRRTYDWAPSPRRRYSSHRPPPPSPRAAGPYHARGGPAQRQGGCLNQMRCGSGAFARALQMKPSPFPWMPDWMSERGRPRRGMLLGLDSRYNQ